jgi:hypothetical protein
MVPGLVVGGELRNSGASIDARWLLCDAYSDWLKLPRGSGCGFSSVVDFWLPGS